MLRSRRGKRREGGQILVLFEMMLIIVLGFVALVVDIGFLRNDKQILVNTVDAAALAGGSQMPVSGSADATTANQLIAYTISRDFPGLTSSNYTITYKCLIGADNTGPLISRDIPAVCDPHFSLGHTPIATDFRGAGPTRVSNCDPFAGDTCNTVVVAAAATTQYAIAPVMSVYSGSTGTISAASCKGPCGAPPVGPVDVVIILDRTLSMSDADIANVQLGAKTVLSVYDPNIQRVALGTIGPSQVSGSNPATANCPSNTSSWKGKPVLGVGNSSATDINYFGPAPTDLARWVPVGFTGLDTGTPAVKYSEAYSTAGVVNTSSTVYKAISCVVSFTQGTNLDTPVREAGYYLHTYGRPGVKKGIILETDGTPQAGDGSAHYTCDQANAAATAVKAMSDGILIYTIGYGVSGATCPTTSGGGNANSHETSTWSGKATTTLLSKMASDPSKFYNSPGSSAVAAAFLSAATSLAGGGSHLIQLYPSPIVTSAGGAVSSITITGQYFSGATSVRVGVALATFTVNGDSTITASVPAGAHGSIVDVTVTTPGGISPITAGSKYTYP